MEESKMALFIGEFDVNPEDIPEAPQIPEGTNVLLEVVKAERKEKTGDDGRRMVWINVQAKAPDYIGSSHAFATLWITEKFRGKPHRSFAQFLLKTDTPLSTTAGALVVKRFIGKVKPNAKNPDFLDVSEVVGAA